MWNTVGEATITDLEFSDDVLIFAEVLEVLVNTDCGIKAVGLKIPWIKTKIQKFVALFSEIIDLPPPLAVHGEYHVSFIDSFVYLGIAIGSGGRSFPYINRHLDIVSTVMNSFNHSV